MICRLGVPRKRLLASRTSLPQRLGWQCDNPALLPSSRLRLVFKSNRRCGTHPQPTPLFDPLRLPVLTLVGGCSGQTKVSRPPTGSFSQTRCPRSLSAPRSSAQVGDLVFYCTEDVEKHVVDDEYGPWADGKEPKEDLVDLVNRMVPRGATTSYEEPNYPGLQTG